MGFATEQQLADYLSNIEPHYISYAADLWAYGVRSASELANGSVEDLVEAGVRNRLHAGNIKATAAGPVAAGAAGGAAAAAAGGAAAAGDPVAAGFERTCYLIQRKLGRLTQAGPVGYAKVKSS